MKKTGFFLIIALIAFSCNQQHEHHSDYISDHTISSAKTDGVFIHITESYEDPHRVLMPLKMATIMMEEKDVIVYMDIRAVELLVKDAEDVLLEGFDSHKTYLSILKENNIGVYACPSCLEVAGYSPDDLVDGVETANKNAFFDFTEGRIITLDY